MLLLALLLQMLAQAAQGGPAFKSSSELVVLHVSVVDRHAGFVSGLPRDVFTVYEDGRPQPVAFFENEDTPVTVGLVIDSSGSMLPRRAGVIAAGMIDSPRWAWRTTLSQSVRPAEHGSAGPNSSGGGAHSRRRSLESTRPRGSIA